MVDVVVVGGGAAGMIAAWRAANLGASTVLLEKNDRLGLKIHISGGGKCNITHAGDMESLRRAFPAREAAFLAPAFRAFTNEDILAMLHNLGVATHARPDGRVFPDSGRADDVIRALERHLDRAGVTVRKKAPVSALILERGRAAGVFVGPERVEARAVVVAVGGKSYPKTGAAGDGYAWAEAAGHCLVPQRAALAPIYLGEAARPDYAGLALRDCVLRARRDGKEIARWRGDLLFTHRGVSGPCVLEVSRAVAQAMEMAPVTLDVDCLPGQGYEALHAAAGSRGGRESVRSLVSRWLPERMVEEACRRADVDPRLPLNQLPRRGRAGLVDAVKRWELGRVVEVPLERGEVTAGGVPLDEVNPATMASRKLGDLYFCGEILDVAGPVGGYNLQAAFSTGWMAGEAAARSAIGSRGPADSAIRHRPSSQ